MCPALIHVSVPCDVRFCDGFCVSFVQVTDTDSDAVDRASASEGTGAVKQLTLHQLREVIEAVYASKLKFDKKCADARLPRETVRVVL